MLSTEERVSIVLLMAELKSITLVRRKWGSLHDTQPPSEKTIRECFNKFKETGSVHDRERSGRPSMEENNDAIEQLFTDHPSTSLRSASNQLNIPYSTLRDHLKGDIGMKPYHITMVQTLYPSDEAARLEMCLEFKDKIANDDTYLSNLFFSDEATFHTNGRVNRHNSVIWGNSNPHVTCEVPIKSPSVCVWAGIYRDRVIGPFIFDSTVKAENYLEMLQTFAVPEMKRLRRFSKTVFMHDGAPCHWANTTKCFLNTKFENRWIGNNGPFHWAPRSPDLTPMDFYFWGHIKAMVQKQAPTNVQDLKEAIRQAFGQVSRNNLDSAFRSFEKRLDLCVSVNGSHFEQLL